MSGQSKTFFSPMLVIEKGTYNLSFYTDAFGAIEIRKFINEDGSIHVSEMSIDGAIFHFHEEGADGTTFSPKKHGGVTTTIGLLVEDVDGLINRALSAGATEISPVTNYDYGLRQGTIRDPFGHYWLIEQFL
jgi:PhnB protein